MLKNNFEFGWKWHCSFRLSHGLVYLYLCYSRCLGPHRTSQVNQQNSSGNSVVLSTLQFLFLYPNKKNLASQQHRCHSSWFVPWWNLLLLSSHSWWMMLSKNASLEDHHTHQWIALHWKFRRVYKALLAKTNFKMIL